MKKIQWPLIVLVLSAASTINGKEYQRTQETCFPLSSIKYEVGIKSFNNGISELEFDRLIKTATALMEPEVKRILNKKLIIEGRWQDPTVDAFATRDDDNNAVVVMNGGLARHPEMTAEGFLVLICREIGHHLGGAPKMFRGKSGLRGWSSAEGQADYYATSKCLPIFYKANSEKKKPLLNGSLSVSKVFASLSSGSPEPKLTEADNTKVPTTIYNHPNPQCRLDTYLAGINCEIGADIPFDSVNPQVGACMEDKGIRPSCWFQERDF